MATKTVNSDDGNSYIIGECKRCKNVTVLKNGYCMKCNEILKNSNLLKDLPKGFDKIFGEF